MRPISPEVEAIQQPIQFLSRQDNGFVAGVGRCFEPFGFEAFEPKAKAVALPIQYLHSITLAIQENEKHRIEHRHLDIQLDQGRETIDGFSEIDRLGVEVDSFDLGVGTHHGDWLQKITGAKHRRVCTSFEGGVHGALSAE